MNDKGFTLIEVVISLAITAVISSLLYEAFRTTLETAGAADKQADVYRRARVIFHQFDKDMSMIYIKKSLPGSTLQTPLGETPFGAIPFKGEDEVRITERNIYPADTLQFVSFSYQPVRTGEPFSGQAEISYSLTEDTLMRNARFREAGTKHELGESILGLNFRYFDEKGKKWVDKWDPDPKNSPAAIEIELTLKDASPSPSMSPMMGQKYDDEAVHGYLFKTVIAIPVSQKVAS